jgi:hypothetical protein
VRLTHGASFVLFALVVTFRTVASGEWPENYIVHEDSESPDGHYGVLVLSQQAAIAQDETDGNTTYLANLQTRKTLGEFAKRIISRTKIIAFCRSSGRPTQAGAYFSTMADTVLSQLCLGIEGGKLSADRHR